jgi:hypothetical protein
MSNRNPLHLSRRASISVAALLAGAAVATVTVASAQSAGGGNGPVVKATPVGQAGPKRLTCRFVRSRHVEVCSGAQGQTGLVGGQGRAGPPGPNGTPGTPGAGAPGTPTAEIDIPMTSIPLTSGFMTDGGNVQNLALVGPVHVDGLCRKTFSPGTGGGGAPGEFTHTSSRNPRYPAPFLGSIGGETEAKVIVWTETGSLSMRGQVGPRINIPPGPPSYAPGDTVGTIRSNDPVAGEGDHMFIAASNETADETRATDPQVQDQSNVGNARKLGRYPAFNASGGLISTSNGQVMVAHMLAGFDALGVYDSCFFAGYIHPVA